MSSLSTFLSTARSFTLTLAESVIYSRGLSLQSFTSKTFASYVKLIKNGSFLDTPKQGLRAAVLITPGLVKAGTVLWLESLSKKGGWLAFAQILCQLGTTGPQRAELRCYFR